ncbi:hypothetical protein ACHAPU_009511 [Fusarium lateritium]
MANTIKLEVKARTRRSSTLRQDIPFNDARLSYGGSITPEATIDVQPDIAESVVSTPQHQSSPWSESLGSGSSTAVGSQVNTQLALDPVLTTFYLDQVFPYLYPLYQPSVHRGGRSWILDLLMTSSTFHQIAMSYSSHFHHLAWPTASEFDGRTRLEKLTQTGLSFTALGQSLRTLLSAGNLNDHTNCACRVLTSVIQHNRYEITTSSSTHWGMHLNAACALFTRLVDGWSDAAGLSSPAASLGHILKELSVPRQEAFAFSISLMLFDDVVAAASSNREPQLYLYHQGLLNGDDPLIELDTVVGVESCVVQLLGRVACLNARKQEDQLAGNLDGLALAQSASTIMGSLTTKLKHLQTSFSAPSSPERRKEDYLDALRTSHHARYTAQDSLLVSQVWTHATVVYLITTVSGWQPANATLRHHVAEIVELLQGNMDGRLLRAMVWPFCVAGCLADASQENVFRCIVNKLRPVELFASLIKAAGVIEWVWQKRRDSGNKNEPLDLATCIQSQGEAPLLV